MQASVIIPNALCSHFKGWLNMALGLVSKFLWFAKQNVFPYESELSYLILQVKCGVNEQISQCAVVVNDFFLSWLPVGVGEGWGRLDTRIHKCISGKLN